MSAEREGERAARRWRLFPARSLAVSLLVGMFLVLLVTVASMFFFANLVVQNQINNLPPEIRAQFRQNQQAQNQQVQNQQLQGRQLQGRPGPDSGDDRDRAGRGAAADGADSGGVSPDDSADFSARAAALLATLPPRLGPTFVPGHRFSPAARARGFLHDVGQSLQAASVVSAAFGLLLALFLARRISRPISAVSEAAVQLSGGDLSARALELPAEREVMELAHTFNRMASSLEVLEQERRQTVASIAHELRTPLTVMQARLDAIEDGIYPLTQQQVAQLSVQTQLLTRLVADLRTLSLAEAHQLTLRLGAVEVLGLAESVARDLNAAEQSGSGQAGAGSPGAGRIRVQGAPFTLSADPDRLRQILVNLGENALKYSSGPVQLLVQPPLAGRGIQIHVDDSGPGIPSAERERVFESFVRLEDSRGRQGGGSGLGLALVRALTRAHGGTVALGTSPLGGTRATVTLPPGQAA